MTFNVKQHQKYVFVVSFIRRAYADELDDFEESFLKSVAKSIGHLSDKQVYVLDKIVKKFFDI